MRKHHPELRGSTRVHDDRTRQHYERYAAFCKRLEIEPADIETWARETHKISEVAFPHETKNRIS